LEQKHDLCSACACAGCGKAAGSSEGVRLCATQPQCVGDLTAVRPRICLLWPRRQGRNVGGALWICLRARVHWPGWCSVPVLAAHSHPWRRWLCHCGIAAPVARLGGPARARARPCSWRREWRVETAWES
jgi:hypothetical protein